MSITEQLVSKFEASQLEEILRSWCLVPKQERKHRLKTIIDLSIEVERIRSISNFYITFGELGIEAVIKGDWEELQDISNSQTFRTESKELQAKFFPLWEKFREIANKAIAEEKLLTLMQQTNKANI
jgi:hypothetical protein